MLNQNLKDECCWCGSNLSQGKLWSVDAKFKKDNSVQVKKGGYIREDFVIGNKNNIWAVITGKESPAKKRGSDVLFICCSHKCAEEVKKQLNEDMKFYNVSLMS